VKGKHPHGLGYKFLNILEEKYKPSDASAKVSLMSELRAIPFKMANDYYNDVVGVTARYDLQLSETSLIEYLTEKVRDTSIAKIIVDHLEKPSGSHDLEALCKDISKVQRVTKVYRGNNSNVRADKEVNLSSAEGGETSESAQKEESNDSGRKTNKPCKHCGKRGHSENACWDKFPDKAPAWFREKSGGKSATKEAGESSNVEVEITL
jgi:hypothetical protein